MGKNAYKLFYGDYFKGIDYSFVLDKENKKAKADNKKSIADRNKEIKAVSLVKINNPAWNASPNHCGFVAKIKYPGLVTGTGLVHDAKKLEGGFNLGLHLDFTTGMPVIYGSSVKGVLRTYFKEFLEDIHVQDSMADDLQDAIFEGQLNGKNLPISQRDIFFDAVIVKANQGGQLLVEDSITPHTAGPLKNPTPITMLKVAPGCQVEFRFILHSVRIDEKVISADEILKIFKEILTTVGVGAKTNVGYGQLKEIKN